MERNAGPGRLGALIESKALRGLVCAGGINFTYLTGAALPGTLGRHLDFSHSERDVFAILCPDGTTAAVVTEIAEPYMRQHSTVDRLFVYRDYRESASRALEQAMDELGMSSGRVGFDLEWFGAERWREVSELMPELEAVRCGAELDRIRAIKSGEEIKRLTRATSLLDQAFSDVFREIRPGVTEREVHAQIVARAIELGVSHIHGMLQTSSNPVLYGGESDAVISVGDLVRSDYVAYVDGYAANLSRPIHIGEPGPETVARYRDYLGVYWEAASLLRHGSTGGQVYRDVRQLLAEAGFDTWAPLCGHGIGSWWHQQYPLLVDGSEDELESGMVLALEPVAGMWHLQDHFLVGESGSTRLSDSFDISELTVIS